MKTKNTLLKNDPVFLDRSGAGGRWIFTILPLVLVLLPGLLLAQTGTITGEVRDADTGESLPGANVVIDGTTIGVATDVDGRYTLRNVPAGSQTVVVRYLGYRFTEEQVELDEEERLVLNIDLVSDMIEGDEIFVVARQRGQARSLTRQRQSVNIRSVISSEQMDRFADQTIDGALQRVAGMGHGGANIRGIGAGASNIVMDGQRMGSTGPGDRSVDLGTISADMVQEMDVIKVITPDMDADAMSGVISISTRRAIGGERTMNARLGGGWNSRFLGMMGPNSRASISYGDSPRDTYSYGINLSYQRDTPATETLSTRWSLASFDDYGAANVLDDVRSRIELDPRNRYGAALQFTFQPTDRTTYHVQGWFNYQDRERMEYELWHEPTSNRYIDPWTTGGMGTQGYFRYNSGIRDYRIHQYTVQAGGRHLFDRFDMEYSMGWGHGRYNQSRYDFPFRTTARYEFIVDLEDRWHPTLEIAPHSERPTFPGAHDLIFDDGVDEHWSHHIDNEFSGSLDFELPLNRAEIKFGASTLMKYKNGLEERYNTSYDRRLNLIDFPVLLNADWNLFNRTHRTYHIPWLMDLQKSRDWYYGEYPSFDFDLEMWAASAETEYYTANENTYATYGMGTLELGRFRFLGGVRVEHTHSRYDGRDGTISDEGRFRGAVDTSAVHNYTNIFPNAQLVFSITNMTNIRLAYSRSIGRPTFGQLNPYVMRNHNSDRLTHGNPKLKPMLSNNLDLLFEHYFMNVAQFTVGLYYKELSDFVYPYTEIIRPEGIDGEGLYSGWRRSTYLNGEEAIAYGLEASWQQNLDFLPGFLGYTGLYANYSYSASEAEVSGRSDDPPRLTDQRPHVVNAGLDYSRGGFSGQISYQWGAPSISSYGDRHRVPEIDPQIRVWYDRYRDAANDLSITLRYRLTDNFRLWLDGSNLLNFRSVSYHYDRDLYPHDASLSGRMVNLGLRYTF